jgi:two-component system, cell cycle response regulator
MEETRRDHGVSRYRGYPGVIVIAAPIAARPKGNERREEAQPLVLVVDDDPDTRFLIGHVLERRGFRVLQAADALAALALCDPNELDVALIDIGLPGMDGLDLLRAINDHLVDQHVPVLLVTGRALASDVATGLGLGASDYLRKPFETSELVARVEAALKTKRLQDQLRQQNRELERLTRTDTLTGAFNRFHLDHVIASACQSARRHGEPLAVLMIDVDHFKQVNDQQGHQTGDRVLQTVAERLQRCLRADDIVGRWGGDEFLVVVWRTDHPGAVALGERLRAAIGDQPVAVGDGVALAVTISVGVASDRAPNPAELIARADRALFEAKAAGRGRVVGG